MAALFASAPVARAAVCDVGALCPDPVGPCTISGGIDLLDLCVLDFGSRTIVLTGSLNAEDSGGSFAIRAGALTLQGGALRAPGNGGDGGGTIDVDVAGDFRMDPTGPRINVSGPGGGGVISVRAGTIDVAAGSPAITADGTSTDAEGGSILLEAAGLLRVDGTVSATGGSASGGGAVTLQGASVQLERTVNVNGGGGDGGQVDLVATAGDVVMTSTAQILANGGRWDDLGSDGGLVELRADAGSVYSGQVSADGATPDGLGGDIGVTAQVDVQVLARLSAHGPGVDSSGGSIILDAGSALLVDGAVDASGGSGDIGGEVIFLVEETLTIAAGRVVEVNGGAVAGEIFSLASPAALVVVGTLEARGTNGGRGGTIDLGRNCRVTVSGTIDARGSFGGSAGDNTIRAGSVSLTATASMLATPCQATDCGNRIELSSGTPSIDPGASVDPPAIVTTSSGPLPCCGDGALDLGEACDDDNRRHCDGCSATCAVEPQPACPGTGLPCVANTCDPARGCVTAPLSGTPCPDDGALCTADLCTSGLCVHPPRDCDDGVACTLDACDPVAGCRSSPQDSQCDDGSPCTVDRCDAASGCQYTTLADGSACDDGSVCTRGEQCQGGQCVSDGVSLACDDGNPCTSDSCHPSLGCWNAEDPALCPCMGAGSPAPSGTACADGNGCTTGDLCDGAGTCLGGPVRSCDDGDPCTTDLCGGGLCLYVDNACPQSCGGLANGTPCSDGQVCTTGLCQDGACAATPHPCDDGDPCGGEEFCAPLIGCRRSFPADGVPCDDGDACSSADTCNAGVCVAGGTSPCAACEACDSLAGCRPAPRSDCQSSQLPSRSLLLVRDTSPDAGDLLVWKWLKGDATLNDLGDPFASEATLCVFEAAQALVLRAEAPAGGTCGAASCWKTLGAGGFRYKDRERTPDGIDKVVLKAGSAGAAKIVLKAKGDRLLPPAPPLDLPIVVQLQAPGGQCFETRHDAGGVLRNGVGEFKGRGGPP